MSKMLQTLIRSALLNASLNAMSQANDLRLLANQSLYLSHDAEEGFVDKDALRKMGENAIALMTNAAMILKPREGNDIALGEAFDLLDRTIFERTDLYRRQLTRAYNNEPDDTGEQIDEHMESVVSELEKIITTKDRRN